MPQAATQATSQATKQPAKPADIAAELARRLGGPLQVRYSCIRHGRFQLFHVSGYITDMTFSYRYEKQFSYIVMET